MFKDLDTRSLDRRRQAARVDSEEAKRELMKSLREAVISSCEPEGAAELRVRKVFARSFLYQDTMIAVPENLATQWLVALRPEGQRCLGVMQGNSFTLRQRNGHMVDAFVLDPFSIKRMDGAAIFDCVYGFNNRTMKKTVFITDVIQMKGNELHMSDFVFRQYFLKEHWPFCEQPEAPVLMGFEDSEQAPEFERIDFDFASRERIENLYGNVSTDYVSDSLIFCQRDGRYISGLSQDALIFRDSHLSRFSIDSKHEEGFDGAESMVMVLKAVLRRAKKKLEGAVETVDLQTWDGIVLHRLGMDSGCPDWLKKEVKKRPFVLVRCEVDNTVCVKSIASSGKPFPHSFNRIVDQFRKRRSVLSLEGTGNEIFDASPLSIETILASFS